MAAFAELRFNDDDAARAYLESIRWPDGPICPHCGVINHAYAIKPAGTYRCAESECRKNFTVTMNSPMEQSHIALHKWVLAFHLMCSSKKGISAHQLHRIIGVTYKSAWFMAHRIRERMRDGGLVPPMGGEGKIVEADETYYGNVDRINRRTKTTSGRPFIKRGRTANKRPIHVPVAEQATVQKIVKDNIAQEARLHTDESRLYFGMDKHFTSHESVKHSVGEYVRGDVHTNSAEGYFSIFKRGMRGVYQHCAEKHLHRYLAEFDFRYNNRIARGVNDGERAELAVKNGTGKRLTYRQPH